jgi:UrcA family protein
MNISFRSKYLSATMLCVIFSIPAVSMAASMTHEENVNPIKVSFSDLNLSQDEGVETLYHRLKVAARKSCGSKVTRELWILANNRQCVNSALAKAVESIDNEKLKRRHSS